MSYKPKLENKINAYERVGLTNYRVEEIGARAKMVGPVISTIIALALKNMSSWEIAASGIIKSESDRNYGKAVTAATIRKRVFALSKDMGFKFNIKDLNLYAQRLIISVIDISK